MPMPRRSPFDRPRWTEQDARAVLAALERSGKPVRAFAEEHGLDPQRLYVWRRRVAEGDGTTFRELIVRPSSPASSDERQPFEIRFPSGIVISVPAAFDSAALERLLDGFGPGRAESSAERPPVRCHAARRRAQGPRQPDGAGTRCAPSGPAEWTSLHLLLEALRPGPHRVLGPQRIRDVDEAAREGKISPDDILEGRPPVLGLDRGCRAGAGCRRDRACRCSTPPAMATARAAGVSKNVRLREFPDPAIVEGSDDGFA
jgi:transposase-like protein